MLLLNEKDRREDGRTDIYIHNSSTQALTNLLKHSFRNVKQICDMCFLFYNFPSLPLIHSHSNESFILVAFCFTVNVFGVLKKTDVADFYFNFNFIRFYFFAFIFILVQIFMGVCSYMFDCIKWHYALH